MLLQKKLKRWLKSFDVLALGPSFFLYYTLLFYLAPFLAYLGLSGGAIDLYQTVNIKAFIYSIIGLIALIIGYYSNILVAWVRKIPNDFKSSWNPKVVPWAFGTTFLLGVFTKIVRVLGGGYFHSGQNPEFLNSPFYSAIGFFDWFSLVAIIIAFGWYYHLKKNGKHNYKIWSFIAWGVFILEILYGLPTGSRGLVGVPIIIFLIIRWYLWKRSYWSLLAGFLLISFIVVPFGNLYRSFFF